MIAWRAAREAYRARVAPWAEDRLRRASVGEKHPVRDFLFEYYSFRPSQLLQWSPGIDVVLEGANPEDVYQGKLFRKTDAGLTLDADAFPIGRRSYIAWAIDYLRQVLSRPPALGCYGLHEWAMVYRCEEIRHTQIPLRLTPSQIAEVVEDRALVCTHYDAYRFFTPAATPRNRIALTRADAVKYDQPGCIHATMDLYKFGYKIAPWVSGELLADAFALAADARLIDMRASPYDFMNMGLTPIPIETATGREEYVRAQRQLAERANPIRERLLQTYERLPTP